MHFSSNVVRFRLTDSMSLSSCSVTIEMQFADSRHGDFSTKKKKTCDDRQCDYDR